MKTEIYNNEEITAYLLGILPEQRTEYFDELNFTNDDFADELNSAEKDLVDAYINGELSAEELKNFNTYYLASPIRREKVEFAKTFQIFAEKNIIKTELQSKQTIAGIFSDFLTIFRAPRQWGFALAALTLILFGGWLFWENFQLRSQLNEEQTRRDEILQRESELKQREKQLLEEISNQSRTHQDTEKELGKIRDESERLAQELKREQLQKQIIEQKNLEPPLAKNNKSSKYPGRPLNMASFILTPTLRGGADLKTISVPTKSDLIQMQLELETDNYKFYQVALQDQSNQIVWKSGKLKSKNRGADKVLNLSFFTKLLKSQIYYLEVTGINPKGRTEKISNYPFRAMLK